MNKIAILFTLALMGCSHAPREQKEKTVTAETVAIVQTTALPEGVKIVEQQPDGYFVRVATAERAEDCTIRAIATALAGRYDRIDLCTDVAHERGDEYASIIDGKLYDYANDQITALR